MTTKAAQDIPQNPVILRCHRIMEAFAKSDDERDFYLDRIEGFLLYVDLDKSQEELDDLLAELENNPERYVPIPKLTFYEVKKLMEGFVNEKVYDIDTKEKLLDIIQSKEARENFLEFIYDHHAELEKWQQYYQERFRVRIIEWLRNHTFDFVFEEDVELTKSIVERVKINMFTPKVSKDIAQARKILASKAATYYSSEALNPRPKRGRPPKQVVKVETEPQFSQDIYVAVPKRVKPFLFTPDYHSSSMIFTFSGKFTSEAELLAFRRQQVQNTMEFNTIGQKLAALRTISSQIKHDISVDPDAIGKEDASFNFDFASKSDGPSSSKKIALPTVKKGIKQAKSDDRHLFQADEDAFPSTKKSSPSKASSSKKGSFSSAKPSKTIAAVKKSAIAATKPARKGASDKALTAKDKKALSTKKEASPPAGKPGSKQKIRLRPLVRKVKKKTS